MMSLTILFFLCFASQIIVHNWPTTVVAATVLNSETDKHALIDLKDKLTKAMPHALPSWNESLHFCKWEGVTCNRRHMRVSVLYLENHNWGTATLSPALGNLTFLKQLILVNINLHGEIPKQVGRLKRLQVFAIINNSLSGQIPIQLTNCTNLQVISFFNNKLTGQIPSWLGSMLQLTMLDLGKNDFVGTIPPSLGNLSSLVAISLAENHLEGSIPHELGRLSNLKVLRLGVNGLSGVIPYSLYNLSNIQDLGLEENKLFGTLPSNMQLVPILQHLFLDFNHFTGTLPSSISNLTRLQRFDISYNDFHGPIPHTFRRLNQLQLFNIGGNRFGSGKPHDLDFLSTLTNSTKLQDLDLFDNRFGGVLPDAIGNFSANLNWINMQRNLVTGRLPEAIGWLTGLTFLSMFENFLEGTIPDSIGKLKNLEILVLEGNKLSGNIPTFIGNLSLLSKVHLSRNKFEGSIPFSLRYCTKMQTFSAYENRLSGDIPDQTFGHHEGLVILYLFNNSLTGSIPSDFGNLKHLSELLLQDNKLSGEIPMELGACLTLTKLSLEGNFFSRSIPSFLGSLRSLEVLDLSNNNFSGIIPPELENLTFLNILNLSFNHLYGEVPKGGVFNNVTAISLIGNKDFCGGIPQLKFPPCSSSPLKKHNKSLRKKLILIFVIGGILISFVVLFVYVYYIRKKPKKLSSSSSMQHKYLRVSYVELQEATNGFSSSNLVGIGSFGSVYKGSLPHFERPIAVKVLNLETRGALKSFIAECEALGKIKHRNLLKILTCCSSIDYNGEDFKAIIFEFMPNGSLESLLHNNGQGESRNINLNLTQRLNIALDVANALDYLHNDSEPAIVHCDIKPSNVLLDDEFVAHLGDFGLARLLHGFSREQVISSAIKGTIGYVPPEYGAGGPITPEGDIYSYGILLLEILTGKNPTDNMFGESTSLHMFCKMAIPEQITEIVDSLLLIPFAEESRVNMTMEHQNIKECLLSFVRIGVACSEEFPAQRMDIKSVIVELHSIIQKLSG